MHRHAADGWLLPLTVLHYFKSESAWGFGSLSTGGMSSGHSFYHRWQYGPDSLPLLRELNFVSRWPIGKSQPVMQRISVFFLALFSLTAANAAEIDVRSLDNGSTLIVIEGDFELNDVDTFRSKIASLAPAKATVAFRSEGGSLVPAIRIGALIREKKFATV